MERGLQRISKRRQPSEEQLGEKTNRRRLRFNSMGAFSFHILVALSFVILLFSSSSVCASTSSSSSVAGSGDLSLREPPIASSSIVYLDGDDWTADTTDVSCEVCCVMCRPYLY